MEIQFFFKKIFSQETNHLLKSSPPLESNSCVSYAPPELQESCNIDTKEIKRLLEMHSIEDRDWLFGLITQTKVFNPVERGDRNTKFLMLFAFNNSIRTFYIL